MPTSLARTEAAQQAFGQQVAAWGDLTGLAVLLYAALGIAARRNFAAGWTKGAVIRYVGRRGRCSANGPGCWTRGWLRMSFPALSEVRLRPATGAGAVAAARLFLLDALIASLNLDDEASDELLSEARDFADRVLKSA